MKKSLSLCCALLFALFTCFAGTLSVSASSFSPSITASSQARVCADTPVGFAHCLAIRFVPAVTAHAKPGGGPQGLNPVDLQSAYKLPSSSTGGGQTVAIVDAYDDPNAESDLGVYRAQFGLPACTTANGCFRKVNDNAAPVDAFQPNLTVAAYGTVSVAFYDRRLACPSAGTTEATAAGLALDQANPQYSGTLPPYGASNYCVNASVQFYQATLVPLRHNIRLTQHSWNPQLHAPHPNNAFASTTFLGDYFGTLTSGSINVSSMVSTYNDGSNPNHYQQQVIATVAIP